ncbi:MAG: diguanylate cyclase [Sphaerochaeta sp.]|uniref:diguanylate cyclase n=1 Tax=Sphaerochaeta sp. TaxID=1972642 RepID=UPI003D127D08
MHARSWWMSTLLILVSTGVLLIFSLVTLNQVETIYSTNTARTIENLKRQFLYDTVNNQIRRIDAERSLLQTKYQNELAVLEDELLLESLHSESYMQRITEMAKRPSLKEWTLLVWDKNSGALVFDNQHEVQEPQTRIESLNRLLPLYKIHALHTNGSYTVFFGIAQDRIDEEVKQNIAQEIYNSRYSEDSYIWVNEIKNYAGGDDYAIRRIHPNLRDTVGMSLSTKMTDIKGGTPYKTELEGVKQSGELFFTYYFQKMNSTVISEKLTYAKLYKDFDWVVAMGIHLDDLSLYIDSSTNDSNSIVKRYIPVLITSIIALFLLHSLLLVLLERRANKQNEKILLEQANRDTLTGVGNRRYGLTVLKNAFFTYKKERKPVLVAMFDIDHFKHINDTYGHDIGDRSLVRLTKAFQQVVCSRDALFRWGGDEFLVVCPDSSEQMISALAETLLATARSTMLASEGISLSYSISIGISSFHPDDQSEEQAIKRADQALYQAKKLGRDRFEIDW